MVISDLFPYPLLVLFVARGLYVCIICFFFLFVLFLFSVFRLSLPLLVSGPWREIRAHYLCISWWLIMNAKRDKKKRQLQAAPVSRKLMTT